jgi:hypothetical protein
LRIYSTGIMLNTRSSASKTVDLLQQLSTSDLSESKLE